MPRDPRERRMLRQRLLWAAFVALTAALSALAVGLGLRLDPDVAGLLPDGGEAPALRRYLRAFGGADLGVVLVEGADPARVEAAAEELTRAFAALPTVERAASRLEARGELDPMLAWRHADAAGRARLAAALSDAGLRARLEDSLAMMLAPGSGHASRSLAHDPLRLVQLAFERRDGGTGVRSRDDGAFATDDGRARLVLLRVHGEALRGRDAHAFVDGANELLARARTAHPGLAFGLTGGHAIAVATESMLVADMTRSGTLSFLAAGAVFALVFRRVRALLAVMPPLLLGTLWTAGAATLLPGGISAIAVAFTSVVVGVGVDTGVHVYAALLEARAAGLPPREAAREARRRTQRPVLVAAATAGLAFASLGLSGIGALRQLGLLCAAGEVLTALAIVILTPEIGALCERKAARPSRGARWVDAVHWLTATRARAVVCAAVALAPIALVAAGFLPRVADAIVAVRPSHLEPAEVQERIYQAFGGQRGHWVAVVSDADAERARERADALAEHLAAMPEVAALDAPSLLAPAEKTQRDRLAERDALDLPARATALEAALAELDLPKARFAAALAGMRAPSHEIISLASLQEGQLAILLSRYLGADGPETVVALYLHPQPGEEQTVARAVAAADPGAVLTGYSRLDHELRASLARDLPRVGACAGVLVLLALLWSLRRLRDVVLAALVVVAEVAGVLVLVRLTGIPLHAYDALVLPVLLGIPVDEGMFLLHRARASRDRERVIAETLRAEAPAIAATALTTAAGFGALAACDFDGLRHLGIVGALGSTLGLVVALVVVPAGLRLTLPARAAARAGGA
ncbi:MAG: MMPL family transporter [Myxococcales bacterium]|nr:MMPL family transporter [Myxococcales bacterium]